MMELKAEAPSLKGLALSEQYYLNVFRPALSEKLPEALPVIAAGLVGEGSDCFGFDDDKSRDHDWGPGVCIWLKQDDSALMAAIEALSHSLPDEYDSFPVRKSTRAGRICISSVNDFYRSFLGSACVPETEADWLSIPESQLAAAVNGAVFEDSCGSFTKIRKALLSYYPEDIRLRKIAEHAVIAAQAGQYNYIRCILREDYPAASLSCNLFLEHAAQLLFLLNRRYCPYYKWTFRAMKELPILGKEIYRLVEEITSSPLCEQTAFNIEDISVMLIQEMKKQGLTDSESDFMTDHVLPIMKKITSPSLRTKPINLIYR